jgi:SWIM zinc finger
MSAITQVAGPQSVSSVLSILQSKAGNRWGRAVEEMKGKHLTVSGDFPEFVVTNKSGTGYQVKLDPNGNGTCTCPDFLVRGQEGGICKHVAAAAITSLVPQVQSPSSTSESIKTHGNRTLQLSPLIYRIRRNVQLDGANGVQVEVQAPVTNDEAQDLELSSYAFGLLQRLASHIAKGTAPSETNFARSAPSSSAVTTTPTKSPTASASEVHPVSAVISKVDRMKTRQGESLFLNVDVAGETVRVFGRPEKLANHLKASGYDIPANQIQTGLELNLPCLVRTGNGTKGYKTIEAFLPPVA